MTQQWAPNNPDGSPLSAEQKASVGGINKNLGGLVDQAMQQSGPQMALVAATLGYDPSPAYQSYLQAWYAGNPAGFGPPPPFEQWVSDTVHAVGTQGVANVIKFQYEQATGKTMPWSVYNQAVDIVRSSPTSVQDALTSEIVGELTNTKQSSLLFSPNANFAKLVDSIGPLQTLLSQATGGALGKQAPLTDAQATQLAAQDAARKTYLNTFGRMPSEALVKQLVGMDSASLSNFYDAQSYHGTTYGQYNNQKEALLKAGWMTWFGHNPSDNDIKWSIGKSPEDITARVDDSPYNPIPGMRIGEYKAYSTEGDTMSKRLFGYSTPDHLVALMRDSGVVPQK